MEWFEDDAFWEALAPFLFDQERMKATPGEIDGLLRLLALPAGARVLDLGCGAGRHSLELARRGFRVTGVDRTRPYLERARAAALQEALEVEFVSADMRAFERPGAFDAALSLLTSFGYFEDAADDLRVLRNVQASLVPGGQAALDTVGKEVLPRVFQARDWVEAPGGALWLQERRLEDGWRYLSQRWIYVSDGRRLEFSFRHRLFSGQELVTLFTQAGFEEVRLFGGFDGSPYDLAAKRLLAVARR